METIGERLLYVIEVQEVNLYQFCKKYSLAYSSYNQIVLNKRSLGIQTLYQMLEIIPNLSVNWLLLGIGDMRIVQKSNSDGELILEEPRAIYKPDEFEKTLLIYLEKEAVKKAIFKLLKGDEEYKLPTNYPVK
jgi:transcriptional regulator with XRE-family HTH domain